MKKFKVLEKEGFELLEKFRIYNNIAETDMDNITKIASEICKFPVSAMCLTDFKTTIGNQIQLSGKPYVIFFAYNSFINSDEIALSMLSILDHDPNNLTIHQIDALKALGNQVTEMIELRKVNQEWLKQMNNLN